MSASAAWRKIAGQKLADLLQRKAEVLQGEDTVQPGQLLLGVVAVTSETVRPRRAQQPALVIKTQRLRRHLP